MRYLRVVKTIKTESTMVAFRGWQGGEIKGSYCQRGEEFQVYKMKSYGVGRWCGLHNVNLFNTLSRTLRNGQDGRFYVMCLLPQYIKKSILEEFQMFGILASQEKLKNIILRMDKQCACLTVYSESSMVNLCTSHKEV